MAGGYSKLLRYQENARCSWLLEEGKPLYKELLGRWNERVFKQQAPLVLELGCGHGAYSLGLAQQFNQLHVIGIDLKGSRLWAGSQAAMREQLSNVRFLRAHIERLTEFFGKGEVSGICINFPDPYPKERHAKRRLTTPFFLGLYAYVLLPHAPILLRTDDKALFDFSCQTLANCGATELDPNATDLLRAMTKNNPQLLSRYEARALARTRKIYCLCFSLPPSLGRNVQPPIPIPH